MNRFNHNYRKQKSKLNEDSAILKAHYKMYKSGRHWIIGGITSATLMLMTPALISKTADSVHADTTSHSLINSAAPATTIDSSASVDPNSDVAQNASSATTSTAPAEAADNSEVTTDASPAIANTVASQTPKKITRVLAQDVSTIANPTANIEDNSLLVSSDLLRLDVTGNYPSNIKIPVGSKIAIKFSNPDILDLSGVQHANVPSYLSESVDKTNGTIYYIYKTGIDQQAGDLGFSISIPTLATGQSNIETTLQDPSGNPVVKFETNNPTVTIADQGTTDSMMVIYPTDLGEANQATKESGINTTANDQVDSYDNKLNITAPGGYLPDGNQIAIISELRLRTWGDGSVRFNAVSEDSAKTYISADGTVNMPGLIKFNPSFGTTPFIGVIKADGQLSFDPTSFKVTDKQTGADLSSTFVLYKISDDVYAFTLNPDIMFLDGWNEQLKHDFVFTYNLTAASVKLDPAVDTASEQMYWVTLITADGGAQNVTPNDGYKYIGDNTNFQLTYQESPTSTTFQPRINGLSDRNYPGGKAITEADLLQGVTANDIEDGSLTSKIQEGQTDENNIKNGIIDLGGLDLTNPQKGNYTITVQVADKDKNITTGTEIVNIKDPVQFNVTFAYVLDSKDGKVLQDPTTPEKENITTYKVVPAPAITGYTFSNVDGGTLINTTDAAGQSVPTSAGVVWDGNKTVYFIYTANDAKATVNYVVKNDDDTQTTVATQLLNGKVGEPITFTTANYLKNNKDSAGHPLSDYAIAEDGTADVTATYNNTGTQTYTVVLEHQHNVVPDAVNTTYTVTYTVNDKKVTAPTNNEQTAKWQADTDLVTGQTTYTTDTTINTVTPPLLKDYTAKPATVNFNVAKSTTTKPTDSMVSVEYTRTTFTPSNPGEMADQLTHVVTEKITYGEPSTAADETQTKTFYRAAQQQADGSFKYSDWTADKTTADNATVFNNADDKNAGSETQTFAALTKFDIPGYTAVVTTTVDGQTSTIGAGAVEVTGKNTTVTRNVEYTAGNAKAQVQYVDLDSKDAAGNSKVVAIENLPGKTGQSIVFDTATYVAKNLNNYEIKDDGTKQPAVYDSTDDSKETSQVFIVTLKHKHATVPATDDQAVKTTYTVTYAVDDGAVSAPKANVQTVAWSSDKDLVTDVTTYTPATTVQDITTPVLTDYTPDVTVAHFDPLAVTEKTPANKMIPVKYVRTTFTPSNPGEIADQLTHVVTQTVTYGAPSTTAKDTQTKTFYRAAQEQGDGSFKYSDWTADKTQADQTTDFNNSADDKNAGSATQTFTALTNYNIPGYTAVVTTTVDGATSAAGAGDVAVTGNNTTVVRQVTYIAGNASAQVVYLDQDADNKQVGEETLPGQTGQTINFDTSDFIAKNFKGYQVVSDQTDKPAKFDSIDDSQTPSQTFTVVLKHEHEKVPATDAKAVKTTYTVNYSVDDHAVPAPKTNVQTISWSSDKDLVTGVTTYTPATAVQDVTTPTLTDYTPDVAVAHFETLSTTTTAPTGKTIPVQYTRTTFTPSHPGTMAEQLTHTVTETISFSAPATAADETHTISFFRAAQKQANGSFKYSDWTTDQDTADNATVFNTTSGSETATFAALTDLHTPAGFIASVTTTIDGQPSAAGSRTVNVTGDNTAVKRTVTYTAGNASAKVVYVDQDAKNKQVGVETLPGQTGQPIAFDTTAYIAKNLKGYEVVSDQTSKGAKYDTADDSKTPSQSFTVVLKHSHELVPATDAKALKTTYTVNYQVDDGGVTAPKPNTQTVSWSSDKDLVTGVTTYTTTDTVSAVTTPDLQDYTPNKSSVTFDVPASTATTPANSVQSVTYTRTTFRPSHPGEMTDQLNHTVTETITYGDPSTAADETHTIAFYRAAQQQADGSFKYSNWTTDKAQADAATDFNSTPDSQTASFDAITDFDVTDYTSTVVTTIDGQTSDAGAGTVAVTANNSIVLRTVSYEAVSDPDDNGGVVEPNTTPTEPETTPVQQTPKETEETPTAVKTQTVVPTTVSAPGVSHYQTSNNQTAKKLPQTSDNNASPMAAIGLGMISVLAMFGIAGKKKRNG